MPGRPDVGGRRYLDMVAAYSAMNFGHRHPQLLQAARAQLERVTLTSRAIYHDRFGPFCKALAELCGMEAVLLMNTGAEAVETAIKAARKWGYEVKEVAPDRAKIIACANCFHGSTVTLVRFSTDPLAHDHYGPYTPGFQVISFGDADALREAIDEDTVAFLVEPIQGEAGVIVPTPGYLREIRDICTQAGILTPHDPAPRSSLSYPRDGATPGPARLKRTGDQAPDPGGGHERPRRLPRHHPGPPGPSRRSTP